MTLFYTAIDRFITHFADFAAGIALGYITQLSARRILPSTTRMAAKVLLYRPR